MANFLEKILLSSMSFSWENTIGSFTGAKYFWEVANSSKDVATVVKKEAK